MTRSWIVPLAVALALFTPVYIAGDLLGWSPTIAGWWAIAVSGGATLLHLSIAEREEGDRKNHRSRHLE